MSRRGLEDHPKTQRHQLDFAIVVLVAVPAAVFLLEVGQQVFCEWQVEFVSLAAVAHVEATDVARASRPRLLRKIFPGQFFYGSKFALQIRERNLARHSPQDGPRVVLDDVAGENTQRRESTGKRGDDDTRNAERVGKRACVQSPCAAESYEDELSRIASTLDGDDTNGFFHDRVDQADNAGRKFFQGEI